MKFSTYQNKVFEFVRTGKGHGIIEAVAGSGKTFTIVEAMKMIEGSALFLAFNKSIAENLQKKMPAAQCRTLHSKGFELISSLNPDLIVDSYKIDTLMDRYQPLATSKYMKASERSLILEARQIVKKMVSLIKNTLIDYNNSEEVYALADYYNIDVESNHLPYITYLMNESNRLSDIVIDFDDMIYLPIYKKITASKTFDWVMVDETQDLNKAQLELVLKLVTPITGRIICVGDSRQSIYGFRGADVGAMARIKDVLSAYELPLSICYRCPSSHLDLARTIVPSIENAPEAKLGEVAEIKEENFVDTLTSEIPAETLVLSRTNASLVSYALKMIAQGKKAIIKGRDIGKGLVTLVKKYNKAETLEDLQNFLTGWRIKEIEKLERRHHKAAIQGVNDKYDCLMNVIASCDTIPEVLNKLENLFNDNSVDGYVFSSVHRAKGLEAETVYILNPEKLPLIWKDQQAWEYEQEMNIKYVAYTRSKNKLVFVNSSSKKI
jgi:DNA helicase-2/ATP-dependent DNA helicase PcrA